MHVPSPVDQRIFRNIIHIHWQAAYLETKHSTQLFKTSLNVCSYNVVNIWDSGHKSVEMTEKYHWFNHVKFYRRRNQNRKEPKQFTHRLLKSSVTTKNERIVFFLLLFLNMTIWNCFPGRRYILKERNRYN